MFNITTETRHPIILSAFQDRLLHPYSIKTIGRYQLLLRVVDPDIGLLVIYHYIQKITYQNSVINVQ